MEIFTHLNSLIAILPTPPTGTPNELAKDGIDFFSLWISRVGGLVAFVGAIKFALSIKDDNAKEQLLSILVMVSGFMIQDAVNDMDIFNIPATYTAAAAENEFEEILRFIEKWIRRVGAAGLFFGAVMFGLSMKDHEAGYKVIALRTIAASGIVMSVAGMLHTFV